MDRYSIQFVLALSMNETAQPTSERDLEIRFVCAARLFLSDSECLGANPVERFDRNSHKMLDQ